MMPRITLVYTEIIHVIASNTAVTAASRHGAEAEALHVVQIIDVIHESLKNLFELHTKSNLDLLW